jgi:hypothetical protein
LKECFSPTTTGTKVDIGIDFASQADYEKIVEKVLYIAAHENLDVLLKK